VGSSGDIDLSEPPPNPNRPQRRAEAISVHRVRVSARRLINGSPERVFYTMGRRGQPLSPSWTTATGRWTTDERRWMNHRATVHERPPSVDELVRACHNCLWLPDVANHNM
jgi:hypothetical protein